MDLIINSAQSVIQREIDGLSAMMHAIDRSFVEAVCLIESCNGKIVLSGMGKSGYVAKKISATLSSTGTPSVFLHPAEASHGDLGIISKDDIVILLSNSGETKELNAVIEYCKFIGVSIIGVTRKICSLLYDVSDVKIALPDVAEASAIGAPTTSAIMMMSWGDALSIVILERKGFSKESYKLLHPGGKIGANLIKIMHIMHSNEDMPIVESTDSFADMIIEMTAKRFGCVGVIKDGALIGIVTDGDLRRHININIAEAVASDFMTCEPLTIELDVVATQAFKLMNDKCITQLFVVDSDKKPVGIVHIHDLLKAGLS